MLTLNPNQGSKSMDLAFMPFFYPYFNKSIDLKPFSIMAKVECPAKILDAYTTAMSKIVKPSTAEVSALSKKDMK